MDERKRKREIEILRGFVHTGASSPFTGMRYRSLQRKYPAVWDGFVFKRDEERGHESPPPSIEPGEGTGRQ